MNLDVLEGSWQESKRFLRDGLLDGAIWNRSTGLTISGMNPREDLVALFNLFLDEVDNTLSDSDFPGLNRYMTVNLAEAGMIIVIIKHSDDVFQGLSLDSKRVNLGLLFNVAIPKALAKVKEAQA